MDSERFIRWIVDKLGNWSRLRHRSFRSVLALPPFEKLVVDDLLFDSSAALAGELG